VRRFGWSPFRTCLLWSVLTGCGWFKNQEHANTDVAPSYPVGITARSDDKQTVAGTQILLDRKLVGVTNDAGAVQLSLNGTEGDTVSLTVKCPASFASPENPIVVGLRHLAPGSRPPAFETQCVLLVHSMVVGIRAQNGAHLPIRRLSQVIGETDDYGVAHVLIQAAANDQIALTLDTTKNDALRPQNPTLSFVAKDHDELVLLEQKFTVQKKVIVVRPRSVPTPL
jgi:hypothetical protein